MGSEDQILSYEVDMRRDDFDGYVEGFGKSSYEGPKKRAFGII